MTAWDLTNYLSPHSPIQTNNCLNRYVIKHYYIITVLDHAYLGITQQFTITCKAMQSIACYFIIV